MIPSESNSERLTRKRLIDPKLKAAGWKIVPFSPQKSLVNSGPCAIEEFETANGPADYGLCVDGRIVGIVEAKKLTLGPQSVLTPAERYCKGNWRNTQGQPITLPSSRTKAAGVWATTS